MFSHLLIILLNYPVDNQTEIISKLCLFFVINLTQEQKNKRP